MKKVIFNADDLGLSKGINQGILKACTDGVATSVSLMVKHQAAKDGVKIFKGNRNVSLGLHFELDKKDVEYLKKHPKKFSAKKVEELEKEFLDQVALFVKLVQKMPDHIDGHYSAHVLPGIGKFVSRYCKVNRIPMRRQEGVNFVDEFFGQRSMITPSVSRLVEVLNNLPDGVSEIMFHPGIVTPDLKGSYLKERELELEALVSPKVKNEIKILGIKPINWKEVSRS
jgi:hypothetical protein